MADVYWGVSTGDNGYGAGDLIEGSEWKKEEGSYLVKNQDGEWCETLGVFKIVDNRPKYVHQPEQRPTVSVDNLPEHLKKFALTDEQRELLRKFVFNNSLSNMFGDGMEKDYVADGFPAWPGVNHMSDQELLEESGIEEADLLRFLAKYAKNEDPYILDDEDEATSTPW